MKRRIGVMVGLAALVFGFAFWRCSARGGARSGAPTVQAKGVGATGATTAAARTHQDPRTLQRASIAGRITDATKAPIGGARVCADGGAPRVDPEVFREPICVDSDPAGAFRIPNLLAATYVVTASARSFRPESFHPDGDRHKVGFRLAAGQDKTGVDIVLRAGGVEITGVVSDINGGPVVRAHVRASAGRWGNAARQPPTETDDTGAFALWVAPGTTKVTASADGYAEASEVGRAPGTFDILLTPESSLSGTVVSATTGEPIENARVAVEAGQWGMGDRGEALSDAKGKFRVTRLTPGRYVASAQIANGYGRTEGSVLVGLGQSVDGVVVKMFPAARIEGKVMIAGATPSVCLEGYAWFRDDEHDRWVSGRTEEDGTIIAEGVLPGTYTARAGCRGYKSADKYPPVVVAGKDVLGLAWEVGTGATIKGRVLDKRGAPIADAQVTGRTVGGAVRDQTDWTSDRSQADGSYVLEGLKGATYALDVDTSQGVPPRDGFKVELAQNATVEKDLVVDDGGTIEGIVVDDHGEPVADVKVQANSLEQEWTWNDTPNRSDATGKFTIDGLRPGDYRVTASRGWFETLRKPGTSDDEKQGEKVTVRVAQPSKVKLVVESQSGTIKGSVVDPDGKPVADAFISSARESDAAGARASSVSSTRTEDWWGDSKPVLTNADGTFVVGNLSPGGYTLRAYRKGGGEGILEHVAVGTVARIAIKHTGSLEGLVKRGGDAPDEITVSLQDLETGFSREEKFYKTAGRFTVRDLPKGHFQITGSAEGGQQQLELDLAEGEHKTGVELTLDALVTITGRVVEMGTQKPVPGMRVFAQPATGGGFSFSMGDEELDNISDDTGRFTVKRVPRGQVAVQGMAKDWKESDFTWFRTLKTISGETSTVDIGDVAVIKKRLKEGEVAGELGVNFAEQPPETPPDQHELKVSFIDPAGPAIKSGLRVGDVITTVDGVDVTGGNVMHAWTLMNAPVGTKLTLGLARGAIVTVVLAAP